MAGQDTYTAQTTYDLCTRTMSRLRKTKITEMARLDVAGYAQSEKTPIIVVLDNVRSMNNVGSVFRTADAFRLEGLYLCGITARPPHPDIHKTALGAEDNVDWRYYSNTTEAVQELLDAGYIVYALEQASGSTSLPDFRPELGTRYALVLGNEVHGVAQEVIDLASHCLEIPQYGTKHSLNVSVAAGIALWQMCAPLLSQHEG